MNQAKMSVNDSEADEAPKRNMSKKMAEAAARATQLQSATAAAEAARLSYEKEQRRRYYYGGHEYYGGHSFSNQTNCFGSSYGSSYYGSARTNNSCSVSSHGATAIDQFGPPPRHRDADSRHRSAKGGMAKRRW